MWTRKPWEMQAAIQNQPNTLKIKQLANGRVAKSSKQDIMHEKTGQYASHMSLFK